MMADRIVITIHLPAALDDVSHVLNAVAERWPTATVDTNHEDGWWITLPSPYREEDPDAPSDPARRDADPDAEPPPG